MPFLPNHLTFLTHTYVQEIKNYDTGEFMSVQELYV